jgi:hypothetical protein
LDVKVGGIIKLEELKPVLNNLVPNAGVLAKLTLHAGILVLVNRLDKDDIKVLRQ